MTSTTMDDSGKLVLRLALGILILLHGLSKLMNGIGFIEGMMAARGLPTFFAYAVYLGEVVAPVLLIVGIYTRLAALVVAVNMVVAIVLVHTGQLFSMTQSGGWALELQGMFVFGAIAVALLGAGRYSVGGAAGRYN
ncbi:DoxX family protein [Verticiella sediminum]|uniref:DoxX family protein n=1 Tax=Verticiella sediminum TaxID=1247510 RepID=A0A556AB51_9BURK|nr:DoxX family protein [Verticiella sediminum]TSH90112.1 DoxX family protein [Verticiella sediminum]